MAHTRKVSVWHKTSEIPQFYASDGMNIGGRLVLVANQLEKATPIQRKALAKKLEGFSHWCYLQDLVHSSYQRE